MLVVETVARIRREFFVKGKSIKEIVRDLGVSRNTVRKVLRSGETAFAYEAQSAPSCDFGQVGERFGNVAFGIDDGNHRRGQFAPS